MGRRGRSRLPFSLFAFQDIVTCATGIIILVTLALALELSQRRQTTPRALTGKVTEQLREAIAATQAEMAEMQAELQRQSDAAAEMSSESLDSLEPALYSTNQQIQSLHAEVASLHSQDEALSRRDEHLQAKRFDLEATSRSGEHEKEAADLETKLREMRTKDRVYYNPRTADGKQVWLVQVESKRLLVARAGFHEKPRIFSQGFRFFQSSGFDNWLTSRSVDADFFFLLVRPKGTADFATIQTQLRDRGFSNGFDLIGDHQAAIDPELGSETP
jgi:hypothetical protein